MEEEGLEEVTDEPLYRDRVCGIDIGKARMAVTIRVPSDQDPGRRMAGTREFGTTRREVLALADWLRSWQVPAVVMEATGGAFALCDAERGVRYLLPQARDEWAKIADCRGENRYDVPGPGYPDVAAAFGAPRFSCAVTDGVHVDGPLCVTTAWEGSPAHDHGPSARKHVDHVSLGCDNSLAGLNHIDRVNVFGSLTVAA
jgi:hypothetical protein